MSPRPSLFPALTLVLLANCGAPPYPDTRALYSEAAKMEARNPVVVIHGILGARLEETATGRTVWGAFTGEYVRPDEPEGARLLALPLHAAGVAEEAEPVAATGPVAQLSVSVLFAVFSVNVYANILKALGVGGYRDNVVVDPRLPEYSKDHYTCFTFFYDWRLDNVENARRLGEYLVKTRREIDATARHKIDALRALAAAGGAEGARAGHEADELDAWLERGYKFDIVAHSMGGLIARYYLRFGTRDLPADGSVPPITWAGAEQIDRLVMVGTPNFGAADAFLQLHEGFDPSWVLPHYSPAVLATMPSVYQLLPRTRHHVTVDEQGHPVDVDLYDPDQWERNRWGIFGERAAEALAWLAPDPEQRPRQVREHMAWCLDRARRFHAALDAVPDTPCPATEHLFGADTESTLTRIGLRPTEGRLEPFFDHGPLWAPGDGTVPRYSAVADERTGGAARRWLQTPVPWHSVTFLADNHVALTENPYFVNNLLFLLLETTPPSLRAIHAP